MKFTMFGTEFSVMERRVIGRPECPLFERLTLVGWGLDASKGHDMSSHERGRPGPALRLHRFYPKADDRHPHNHPWPFWTLVLRGGYDDLKPCPVESCDDGMALRNYGWRINAEGGADHVGIRVVPCYVCEGRGAVVRERMRAGTLRYRPAEHVHRTLVHDDGCLTLVLTLPARRRWGFWVHGKWMWWKDYEREVGPGLRCEEGEVGA